MRRTRTALFVAVAVFSSLLATSAVGAQTVICSGLEATIVGTPGNDIILGTSGDDVIFAAQGDDRIQGGDGDDVICAGQGDDVVFGGEGFDIIFGAQGDDELYASNGDGEATREDIRGARMFGGAGNDDLYGSNRWDRMQGGPGIDQLFGFEGRDWLRGGADRDFVNGGLGIDDVHGGNGSDRLTVTNGDSVRGGNGVDWCVMGGPADTFVSCGRNRFEAGIAQQTLPGGTYDVPSEAAYGFWRTATYFELNDANGSIVTNDFSFDGQTIAVVDPRGVSVEFRETATRVEAGGPVNVIGQQEGRALVGLDIPPGEYRVVPTAEHPGAMIETVDGRGRRIDIENGGSGAHTLTVGPEAVFLSFLGRLERIS